MAEIIGGHGQVDFNIDGLEDTNHLYRRNTDFNKIINNAQAFIGAAQDSQLMDKIRAETDEKLKAQEVEMAELRAMIAELTTKKAGRPKKELVE